jgi:hypothetical protein
MKFIFLDETSDSDKKDYFGVCCVIMDSYSYKIVKEKSQNILSKSGWDRDIEFKGSTLFSITKGDTSISVEKRIEIAKDLLSLNLAQKNARVQFAYCDFKTENFKSSYLQYLPTLLSRVLPRAPKGAGKDLISIHYDQYDSISQEEFRKAIKEVINKKKYGLFEDVMASSSGFETTGILFADLVAYLYGRVEVITKDIDLFKDLPPEKLKNDGRNRKLQSSKALLTVIKQLKGYEVA